MRFLPLIVKNCWRNRRRTVLTVLSIGVSMCVLGVLMAVYYAFYLSAPAPEQALRLVTRNKISLTFPLPQFYAERIRRVPGVREVMVYQWYGGVYKDSRDPKNFFARFAVEPEKLFLIYPEFRLPEDQKGAFLRERTACVIGRDLSRKHGFRLGDRITLTGDIFPGTIELMVRGIFDSPRGSEVLYFHRPYLEEGMSERRKGQIGTLLILAESVAAVPRVAAAVDEQFRNATAQTRTETEQAFSLSFTSYLGNVKLFLISISAAVTFTILLVSANTMAMSVRERVCEVGVLKTLGFTPRTVLSLIVAESAAIALAGGALGLVLATLLCGAVKRGPGGMFFSQLSALDPPVAMVCVLTAATIGVISSFIPAWSAARTPIVEALRSTE